MSRLTTYASGCVAALAAVLLLALPTAALANASAATGLMWPPKPPTAPGWSSTYPYCVSGTLGLYQRDAADGSFPTSGLFPTTSVSMYTSCAYYDGEPYADAHVVPAGWLAIYRILYVWNGSNWATCTSDSDWVYNANAGQLNQLFSPGTAGTTANGQKGPVAAYPQPATGAYGPCGPGYYGLVAYTYGWTGSEWLGGGMWSGYIYTQ